MAQGVETIVKVIAPTALNALASAAEALLAGGIGKLSSQRLKKLSTLTPADAGEVLLNDTRTYIESKFAETYGYYYQGLQSQPLTGHMPIAAAGNIIIYDTADRGTHDIETHLQTVFQKSISPADSITISTDLSQLFSDRFQEESLSWTPFKKRFNFLDGIVVDAFMVTSATHNIAEHLSGIVTYCFVAYGKSL